MAVCAMLFQGVAVWAGLPAFLFALMLLLGFRLYTRFTWILLLLGLAWFVHPATVLFQVFVVSPTALDPVAGNRAAVPGVVPQHGRCGDLPIHQGLAAAARLAAD